MSVDLGLLILRIGAAGLMLSHGIPKLLQVLGGDFQFADPIGIGQTPSLLFAVFAEFLCSVAVLVGFKARWAAIPIIVVMLTAAGIVHADDPFNKKELPLLYAVAFGTIAAAGSGRHSLDAKLTRRAGYRPT